MNTQNTTEQKSPEEIKAQKSQKTMKLVVAAIIVVFGVAIVMSNRSGVSNQTASYYDTSNSAAETVSSSSFVSKPVVEKHNAEIADQKQKAAQMKSKLESSGYIILDNGGYTQLQCLSAARTFMKNNYGTDFYDASVVVAMSKNSISAYVITGCEKGGDPFVMGIAHVNQKWVVTECKWN